MKLTDAQKKIAYVAWEDTVRKFPLASSKALYTAVEAVIAALPEPAITNRPAPTPDDVIEIALEVAWNGDYALGCKSELRKAISAAIAAADRAREMVTLEQMEKAINEEGERISWQGFGAETTFAKAVIQRLRPAKAKTAEERVTVSWNPWNHTWLVIKDDIIETEMLPEEEAQIYRDGLIARLKAQEAEQKGGA